MSPATPLEKLHHIRRSAGPRDTVGLSDEVILHFLPLDPRLGEAIDAALQAREQIRAAGEPDLTLPESELITWLQADILNFYEQDAINPYVPMAAAGPWIVTSHGAVLHDSGGYGMLGFGHAPPEVLEVLARPWVMANVMTPSFSHRRLTDALRREVGHTRGACPFSRFVCMNSGSESVSVAARISDINALRQAQGRPIKFLALQGGFHGRTDRPAQASASSKARYHKYLASFQHRDNLVEVPPNDTAALRQAFAKATDDGVFFEMMLVEPVMGEGNPGLAITREFYDAARELCTAMGTLLLIDSIQAGLRTHGVLSIVDYPGFETALPPDMETWSKALNAAQIPLSVLALTAHAAGLYERGVYGNTMTGNPRAAEAAVITLSMLTPALRANIRARGEELLAGLIRLHDELPDLVLGARGTGLLVCADINPSVEVVGPHGLERWCRLHGLGVIHGGKNSLRFTPHFAITSEEIRLMLDVLREAMRAVMAGDAVVTAAAK